ncbi:hypothetical protein LCGC14_1160600 [marine sediment metagenome]|uniref:DUF559 domain-containing protein n=1 Tax=marine sediment metagenome TaxID=412755 RepID=A0A0F9LXR5_9ZZZZ
MPVQPPIAFNFRRRRTTFDVDIGDILGSVRNGMRVPLISSPEIAREGRFQKWLFRVGGTGSRPEFMVFEALERVGLFSPYSEPFGLDFEFQVPIAGGRAKHGGAVLDFLVHAVAPELAIRVQGEFFHFIDDDAEAADIVERKMLETLGFQVVDILAQDTLTEQRVDEVVGLALLGFQLEFTGRLQVF